MVRGEEALDIRQMYKTGLSVSEIARRTGHDRKTVRRVIKGEIPRPRQATAARPSKLDPYKDYILKRMAEGVTNAVRICKEIREQGYDGGMTILRDFMHPHRPAIKSRITVRFETPPGRQAQMDTSEFTYQRPDGTTGKLHLFELVLGYSRLAYAEFMEAANQLTILQALRRGLAAIGGVPAEILSDNTSPLVRRHDAERRIVQWQPTYLDFAEHYGFVPRAHIPYRPQTKGKVERLGGYVRTSFWPVDFTDVDNLNRQLWEWLNKEANTRIHGTTYERPLDRWQVERKLLTPLTPRPYVVGRIEPRKVAWDGMISWDSNRYSVPWLYAAQTVLVRQTEDGRLEIQSGDRIIAHHETASGRGYMRLDRRHQLDIPAGRHRRHPGRALGRLVAPEVEHRPLGVYAALAGGDE